MHKKIIIFKWGIKLFLFFSFLIACHYYVNIVGIIPDIFIKDIVIFIFLLIIAVFILLLYCILLFFSGYLLFYLIFAIIFAIKYIINILKKKSKLEKNNILKKNFLARKKFENLKKELIYHFKKNWMTIIFMGMFSFIFLMLIINSLIIDSMNIYNKKIILIYLLIYPILFFILCVIFYKNFISKNSTLYYNKLIGILFIPYIFVMFTHILYSNNNLIKLTRFLNINIENTDIRIKKTYVDMLSKDIKKNCSNDDACIFPNVNILSTGIGNSSIIEFKSSIEDKIYYKYKIPNEYINIEYSNKKNK